MNEQQLLALIKALSRLGAPLRAVTGFGGLGSIGGGLGSAINLFDAARRGNVGGAVGSGANLAGLASSLLGQPGVASALGSVGGPIGLVSGLASGNYGNAAAALPATVAAGANAAGGLGLITPSLASGIGAGASAFALPVALAVTLGMSGDSEGMDIFDSLFGNAKTKAQKQIEEHKNYVEDWPDLVKRRAQGASLMDHLGAIEGDVLPEALLRAESGIRATDLSPAYSHLKQAPDSSPHVNAAKIPGMDMSPWEAVAPELEGKNWGAFVGLMDRAAREGRDGANVLGFQPGTYQEAKSNETPGMTDEAKSRGWGQGVTSRESDDLSNAIAGIGQQLGIDWTAPGMGTGKYTISADRLQELGLTPGNYGSGILAYLKTLDPNIESHANYAQYRDALGAA